MEKTSVKRRGKRTPFVIQQLKSSGLVQSDVMAKVFVSGEDKPTKLCPFRQGGIDRGDGKAWEPNTRDDEMLIYYYDRHGNPRMYATRGAAGNRKQYVRVRWSNPDVHLADGKPMKYQSPPKSQSIIYIPQVIRDLVASNTLLDTLYIQEGEKKAEKACKHGIPSVAIQGIWNIGTEKAGVDPELQYLIQDLDVHNVVMVMDSDFDHLSSKLDRGDEVINRPSSFAGAIIKFRKYIRSLKNVGINAEIWFAHIKENENGDKGLDDLLTNTLVGRENELMRDFEFAKNSIDGNGKYVGIKCITTISEEKIKDIWLLNDRQAFVEKYKSRLLDLEEFKFRNIQYEVVNGEIVASARLVMEQDLWEVETNEKGRQSVNFDKDAAIDFLKGNGFYRFAKDGMDYASLLLHDSGGIVRQVTGAYIRDFFWNFVLQTTKSKLIRNYFYDTIDNHLSDSKVLRLPVSDVDFKSYSESFQYYYFKNLQCKISEQGIETEPFCGPVWSYKIINRNFSRVPIIDSIVKLGDDAYSVKITDEGEKCEFLKFLQLSSTIRKSSNIDDDEEWDAAPHLVNKITSIGFLLSEYRSLAESIAIVALDYTVSDDNTAMGGTGKSMIGNAIGYVTGMEYINGRKDVGKDQFLLSLVSDKTRVIFLDDVRKNFEFSDFYNIISGDLEINPKGEKRYKIPKAEAPKLFIATNYAITDNNDSSERRINYMLFTNYFSKDYTPFMEFGHELFNGWDDEQWNLFYNLMMECVFYYFHSRLKGWCRTEGRGAVQPPMRYVSRKKFKLVVPVPFFEWAEAYYSADSGHLNKMENRKDVFVAFRDSYEDAKSVSSASFKKCLINYCQYKGYDFNRHRPSKDTGEYYSEWIQTFRPGTVFVGDRSVSGGAEHFLVSERDADILPALD